MTIDELLTRGVQDIVPAQGFRERLKKGKIKLYLGIDPTSTRLTLGHTVPLRKLKHFQDLGHEVILLVGSFTALIGDTSDKEAMRQPLTPQEIERNFATYKEQASKVLDFSRSKIVYNGDWLSKLTFRHVVELAQHFTVQQMIERDMYQKRLKEGKPIGHHEFLYPLMQGYDSVHMEVDLEVGGNDQLFNMMAGRTLLKAYKNREKWVMTTPLIEGTDGRKMSKTYGNSIDLTDPPAEMFGKIMSMSDNLIIKYFVVCTDLSLKEIDGIDVHLKQGGNPRDAKVRLAREIVAMYHSANLADEAEKQFFAVFRDQGQPEEMPEFKLRGEKGIIDLLLACNLVPSKSEARRMIEQGGVKIDGEKITKSDQTIPIKKGMVLQVGKRKWARVL